MSEVGAIILWIHKSAERNCSAAYCLKSVLYGYIIGVKLKQQKLMCSFKIS